MHGIPCRAFFILKVFELPLQVILKNVRQQIFCRILHHIQYTLKSDHATLVRIWHFYFVKPASVLQQKACMFFSSGGRLCCSQSQFPLSIPSR